MAQPYFLIGAQWLNPILKSSEPDDCVAKSMSYVGLRQVATY
ncbi:MAG: hypothetical protein WA963_00080 [Bermanella sp.]